METSPTDRRFLTLAACGPQVADPAAHGHEGPEVAAQALIRLLVQAGEAPEAGPFVVGVLVLGQARLLLDLLHAEGGHHAVEVTLLPTRPPGEAMRREIEVLQGFVWINRVCLSGLG